MKVSNIEVELSSEDLLSIVKDYVKIDGLKIDSFVLDHHIVVNGSYKMGIKIPFSVTCSIEDIMFNSIVIKIICVKCSKVQIFSFAKNFLLKTLMSGLEEQGFSFVKDYVQFEFSKILKTLPFQLGFKLNDIVVNEGMLKARVEDLELSLNKCNEEAESTSSLSVISSEGFEDEIAGQAEVAAAVKVVDDYSRFRGKIQEKVPSNFKKLVEMSMIMPDIAALFYRLFRDKRVDFKTKIMVGGVLAYIVSPIELIPDFIPFIGKIDDLALAFFALNKILNEIPNNIVVENWEGNDDIIIKVREGVEFITRLAGGANVSKLFIAIKKLNSI
jgi:uncharacterized membrane protein YkvA (DUF1232 family)